MLCTTLITRPANEQYQEHSHMYMQEKERLGMALIEGKFPPTRFNTKETSSHSIHTHQNKAAYMCITAILCLTIILPIYTGITQLIRTSKNWDTPLISGHCPLS